MIDNSDLLIAYVKYSWGGAARTLEYAKRRRMEIIYIDVECTKECIKKEIKE